MSIYDINGNVVFSSDSDSSYFEVISETTGNKLQPKSAYQSGFYRGMSLNTYFQTFFKENYSQFAPSLATMQTRGKSLYIGGDSLHAYAGGDGMASDGFITDYNDYLGFSTVKNDGYAGATMSGTGTGGGVQRAKALIEAGVPYDVFIFAYGTNNDTNGLGTASDEASDTALTLAGGMKWIIENMRTAFPKSAIGFVILPPSSNADKTEQHDLMIDVCEAENMPYVDMFLHVSKTDLSDGTHLGGGGAVKYGSAEAKLILDICPYGEPLQ